MHDIPKSAYTLFDKRVCGLKLLIHSETSTVQPLKFGNGSVISSNTLPGIWLLIHAGIKDNPC